MARFEDILKNTMPVEEEEKKSSQRPRFEEILKESQTGSARIGDVSQDPFLSTFSGRTHSQPTQESRTLQQQVQQPQQALPIQDPVVQPSPAVGPQVDPDVPQVDDEGNLIFPDEVQEELDSPGNASPVDDMAGFLAEASHKVSLAGETVFLGTAEFFDFLRKADNWRKSGDFELPTIRVNDVVLPTESFEKVLENSYFQLKESLGEVPKRQVPEDTSDIFIELFSQNLAGTFGLAAIRKSLNIVSNVPGAAKVVDDLGGFLKTETKLSAIGAATGTAAASITDGDIENQRGVAQMWNLMGMVGVPVIGAARGYLPSARAWKLAKKNKLFDRSGSYQLTENAINTHLADLVQPAMIPKIKERIRLVKRIQQDFPDFQPTVGNMLGTEEAKLVQRMVDSKNIKFASDQYLRTKLEVERMVKRFTSDTDPESKARLAAALSLYADETSDMLTSIRTAMGHTEEKLRRISDVDFSTSETGTELRASLKEMQDIYRSIRDDMFDSIDPEGVFKFNPANVVDKVKEITEGGDPLKRIREGQAGFDYFSKELPAILREMSQRSKATGTAGLGQALGATAKEQPHLTVNDVMGIYKQLGARATDIASKFPSSDTPRIMRSLQDDLLKVMDDQIGDVIDPDVAARYAKAREFMSDEYYPRFSEGAGGKLNKKATGSSEFEVALDDVGSKFWKAGKEVPTEDFNLIFRETAKQISGEDAEELIPIVREMAIDSLEAHAINTLQKEINSSKDTLAAISRWKERYNGALRGFPEVAKKVDEIEIKARAFDLDQKSFAVKEKDLHHRIISKFTDTDPDKLMDDLFSMTPKEADTFLADILTATQRAVDNPKLLEDASGILKTNRNGSVSLDQSLRYAFQRRLVAEAHDGDTIDFNALNKLLNGKKKQLIETVLLPEEVDNLKDLSNALKLMGSEPKQLTRPDLNTMNTFLKSFGISIASMQSRYYAASLGKVGEGFLITDAATRVLTGIASKHFDEIYRNTMYDLDGLENILRHVGSEEAVALTQGLKAFLQKNAKTALKKGDDTFKNKLLDHLLLIGYRVTDADRETDVKDTGRIVENYMLINDDLTGQPSRINPRIPADPIEEGSRVEIGTPVIVPEETLEEGSTVVPGEANVSQTAPEELSEVSPEVPEVFSSAEANAVNQGQPALLSGVDFEFIAQNEGKAREKAYVPQQGGKAIDQSGVTVATGFDIGQHSMDDLDRLNLSSTLKTKLEPYLGLKKSQAISFLNKNPLVLTESEVSELDQAKKSQIVDDFSKRFDAVSSLKFEDLPGEAKTVLLDVATQYGTDWTKKGKPKNFWKQVTTGDWDAAVKNLKNFGDNFPTRRKKEAKLLEQADFTAPTSQTAFIEQDEAVRRSPSITSATLLPKAKQVANSVNTSSVDLTEQEADQLQQLLDERRKSFSVPTAPLDPERSEIPVAPVREKEEEFTDDDLEGLFSATTKEIMEIKKAFPDASLVEIKEFFDARASGVA